MYCATRDLVTHQEKWCIVMCLLGTTAVWFISEAIKTKNYIHHQAAQPTEQRPKKANHINVYLNLPAICVDESSSSYRCTSIQPTSRHGKTAIGEFRSNELTLFTFGPMASIMASLLMRLSLVKTAINVNKSI